MKFVAPSIDFLLISPFVVVAITGMITLLLETLKPRKMNAPIVGVSLTGLAVALGLTIFQIGLPATSTLSTLVTRDSFGLFAQVVMIGATILCFLFSESYLQHKKIGFGEFYPLATWALLGGMVMVATDNFMTMFVGLEVLSVALYCLAGMSRDEHKSEEAALKYFLLGALASAFFLFGVAYVFGAGQSTALGDMTRVMSGELAHLKSLAVLGLGFVLVGLAFKSALVPFHNWTPDVYQGAPTNITAFMSVVSKVAAIVAMARVLIAAAPVLSIYAPAMILIAGLTMTIGNIVALAQRDVKRVLGYSSIANAGYLLVAVLAHTKNPTQVDLSTTIFFLINYAVMTVGGFAVLTMTAYQGREGTRFGDVAGLWKRSPLAGGSLVVFLASMIGIPFTGGFLGKFSIFVDAMKAGLMPLAILLAINSAISAYYYLMIMRAVFVDQEPVVKTEKAPMSAGLALTCVLCLAGVFGVGIFGGSLMSAIGDVEARPAASFAQKPIGR